MNSLTNSDPLLVNIILPTYNRAHLAGRAIKSVLEQTYQNFELIIVDDASSDNTADVVASFDDARIRYIQHTHNRGAAAARNTGIKASQGNFIAFQDSDDVWEPEKLDRQMVAFERSSLKVGVVYTGFWRMQGQERTQYPPRFRKWVHLLPTQRLEGDIHQALLGGNFITTQATLVRKVCFNEMGLFDEQLPRFQDWELWIRLSERYHFKYIDAPLVNVYATAGSISTDDAALLWAFQHIVDKHKGADKDALHAHYAYVKGDLACRRERVQDGRRDLLAAVRLAPFRTAYWIATGLSFLGRDAYIYWMNLLGLSYFS